VIRSSAGPVSPISVGGRVRVGTAPDVVFDYLADPTNQVQWTPNFVELLEGPDRDPGLGMRYRGRLKVFGPVNFAIDQFEPGRVFRVDTDPVVGRLTHRFAVLPDGRGAVVDHLVELWPRRVVRPVSGLMRLLLQRMVTDLNRQMRQVLESL
jgi:hypothetical protein